MKYSDLTTALSLKRCSCRQKRYVADDETGKTSAMIRGTGLSSLHGGVPVHEEEEGG
jgi:hypothetical protein